MSRQKVNLTKLNIYFSTYICSELQDEIVSILEMKIITHHWIYLGLPALVGQSKLLVFTKI